ncbi:hypothetical protein [Kitasatospora paracochleata]|uniref:Uncharacterized protein n=1 Tax=Kitasatospora paracochleata TaxID=58354 RepID=A0ABT1J920_9ACTN|nr:hypothetical protein [Kitasatospora paracochleata]MCP2313944.1 hypothetical protein [Kitasatospora paracochleata]
MGKIGDWRIPMGPYTPPQLVVAAVGAFLLIRTVTWWAPVLGPLPVVVWAVAIWAARHSRIAGRSPFLVAADAASLLIAPRGGRIAGRAVRPMRPVVMTGSFTVEEAPGEESAVEAPAVRGDLRPEAEFRSLSIFEPRSRDPLPDPLPAAPVTGPALTPLQQMLAAASAAHTQKGEPS